LLSIFDKINVDQLARMDLLLFYLKSTDLKLVTDLFKIAQNIMTLSLNPLTHGIGLVCLSKV